MKSFDLKVHENGNLCSIKFDNIESARQDVLYIISVLNHSNFKYFHVFFSRPISFVPDIVIWNLRSKIEFNDFYISPNNFELKFWSECGLIDSEYLLYDLLNIFEHGAIIFTNNLSLRKIANIEYWKNITEMNESIIIFKGVENDVIWLGKSKELNFDFKEKLFPRSA